MEWLLLHGCNTLAVGGVPLWKLHRVINFNFPAQNEKLGRLHSLLAVCNAIISETGCPIKVYTFEEYYILSVISKYKVQDIKNIVCIPTYKSISCIKSQYTIPTMISQIFTRYLKEI